MAEQKPNDPKAPTAPETSVFARAKNMIGHDLVDAGKRTMALRFLKLAKPAVTGMALKAIGKKNRSLREAIEGMVETRIGEAALAALLSVIVLPFAELSAEGEAKNKVAVLAAELRTFAFTQSADLLADSLFGHVLKLVEEATTEPITAKLLDAAADNPLSRAANGIRDKATVPAPGASS